VFFPNQLDPEKERAKLYQSQRALEEQKLSEAQGRTAAQRTFAGSIEQIMQGAAPERMDPNVPITEAGPDSPVPLLTADPEKQQDLKRAAAARALAQSLGAGGDEKDLNPILQAFLLAQGDDEGVVRANAALEGDYLGDSQSPSLARQVEKIEDEQKFKADEEEKDRALQKYGFDTASSDRRYNTDVDAATSRSNNAASNATSRANNASSNAQSDRNSRRTDARGRELAATETVTVREESPGTKGTPAKGRFLGIFGDETPAKPGRPKTVTTRTRRSRAGPQPGGQTRLKYNPATGQTE
jgi:hypothetical protein